MSKVFIVLGMHRSATSLAAKGLIKSGIYMGKQLLPANKDNSYGYWEDVDFITMNTAILKKAGGSWENPPSEENIINAGKFFKREIKELIRIKSKGKEFWGWKDPRTTLTIKCYLKYLENPHFIVCFRETEKIAESLRKRNHFSKKKCIELANEYNLRLLSFIKEWYGFKS